MTLQARIKKISLNFFMVVLIFPSIKSAVLNGLSLRQLETNVYGAYQRANPLILLARFYGDGYNTRVFDYGSLAQLVEHWTFNPLVPRSSRGRPTIL